MEQTNNTGLMTIHDIEESVGNLPAVDTPLEHIFTEGLYTRVMTLFAGTIAVGKRHKGETLNILLKGRLLVYVGPNEPPYAIDAPYIFKSEPNVKKIALAVTDVLLANIHPTEETDLDIIEAQFIIKDEDYTGIIETFPAVATQLLEKPL